MKWQTKSERDGQVYNRIRPVILFLLLMVLTSGCFSRSGRYAPAGPGKGFTQTSNAPPEGLFMPERASKTQAYANPEQVDSFSAKAQHAYLIGPGDVFTLVVRGRPDVSLANVIVSPDGQAALPRIGILNVAGQTLDTVTSNITQRLLRFYEEPEVTIVMKEYNNNKVYVLGRVANPGVVHFEGRGNLLEALSLAGGLPVDTTRSWLSRCMIVRGKDMLIWIDLQDLLDNGNMALNARLNNGDVIYIPQSLDQVAYIMGEVTIPGILQLRSKMTVLDGLMSCGGVTDDAIETEIYLIRGSGEEGFVDQINLKDMYARADMRKNYTLQDGDIIYVPEKGMSRFNYYMTQLLPSLTVLDFTLNAAERFGAMQAVRESIWGQEGFVNGSP